MGIFLLLFCLSMSTLPLGATVCAFISTTTTSTTTATLSYPRTINARHPTLSLFFAAPEQDQDEVAKEVQELLARAKAIRESLPAEKNIQPGAPTDTESSVLPSE